MKVQSQKIILVLLAICVATLTGCGVSQSKHQEAVKELEKIKSVLVEQQITLQEIQNEERTIEAKESEIKKLKDLENSTFDDAEACFKAHDTTNAYRAYIAFVRDFPESSKISLAQDKISKIKWVLDAPIREAQAKAVALAQTEDLKKTAFAAGYEQGKDDRQTGGDDASKSDVVLRANAISSINFLPNSFPRRNYYKDYPVPRDAYIAGFIAGYRGSVSYASLHPQEAAELRSQNEANARMVNSTVRTVKGDGSSKGDAYAAARQKLPAGAEEINTVYDWSSSGSDWKTTGTRHYYCKITYRAK